MPTVVIKQTNCPDANIEVNGSQETTVGAGNTSNITLIDQDSNPIVPTTITPTGADLEIEINIPASCDEVNLTVNALTPIAYTGLTGCPYEIGLHVHDQEGTDRGSLIGGEIIVYIPPRIDSANFLLLNRPNAFGNYQRFTGTTGGYKVGANYFDVDGVATTEALALPSDIILDWGQSNYDGVPAVTRVLNSPVSNGSLATIEGNIATLNAGAGLGGFNDWSLVPRGISALLCDITDATSVFNYDPFNYTPNTQVYCLEPYAPAPTTNQWYMFTGSGAITQATNTTNRSCRLYREYSYADLGISF
jgi:hypothetical protein